MTHKVPTVLITIGDPSGSGPELAVKTALDFSVRHKCRPVLIGAPEVIEDTIHRINMNPKIEYVSEAFLTGQHPFSANTLHIFSSGHLSSSEYTKGAPCAAGGQHIVEISRKAAKMSLDGLVSAVCSAPASKVSLYLAGYEYSGMSDVFSEVTGAKSYETMLVLRQMRLVLATSHVPFRSVPDLLRKDRVVTLISKLREALIDPFGIYEPRIGVAALNPHAGEQGLYGQEELDILVPAVESAKQKGIGVFGPIPADFLIPRIQSGEFDGAVMLYHDQAHIPLKALGLFEPATLLLGVPMIRTSVAHGTAYGKALSGTANCTGMVHACMLAADLATKKKGPNK